MKKKDEKEFSRINKTIDLGRTSPNFICNSGRISRKSIKSSSSQRSNISRSSQTSTHKNRLNMVREREKQIQQFKKKEFLERQR